MSHPCLRRTFLQHKEQTSLYLLHVVCHEATQQFLSALSSLFTNATNTILSDPNSPMIIWDWNMPVPLYT